MSFYGNSFYYAIESFAQIVLANLGLKADGTVNEECGYNTTTPPKDYSFVLSEDDGFLTADSRKETLGIVSGNHWIKIGKTTDPNKNSLCLMHGAPVRKSKDQACINAITPVELTDEQADLIKPQRLSFDDYFSFPKIEYDDAGHIVFDAKEPQSCFYYQMPKNPLVEFDTEIKKITGEDGLLDKLEGRLQVQIDDITTTDTDVSGNPVGTIAKAKKELQDQLDELVRLPDPTIEEDKGGRLHQIETIIEPFEDMSVTQIMDAADKIEDLNQDLILLSPSVAGNTQHIGNMVNWLVDHVVNGKPIAPGTTAETIKTYQP